MAIEARSDAKNALASRLALGGKVIYNRFRKEKEDSQHDDVRTNPQMETSSREGGRSKADPLKDRAPRSLRKETETRGRAANHY